MKILNKKVKEMSNPKEFPFTSKEMTNIVDSDNRKKDGEKKKIKKIITNIYSYKANISYTNRMKMINQIIHKQ